MGAHQKALVASEDCLSVRENSARKRLTAGSFQGCPLKLANCPKRATSTLQWGHAVRCRVRVLAAINDATGNIDVLSMVDERGSDERDGVINSSQDTHTAANDVSSLQS